MSLAKALAQAPLPLRSLTKSQVAAHSELSQALAMLSHIGQDKAVKEVRTAFLPKVHPTSHLITAVVSTDDHLIDD